MNTVRIRHAAGEFVLIVAGVLVALAAQTWWQNRDNREREQSYMRALEADCATDSALIHKAIAEENIYLKKAQRLKAMLSSSDPIQPDSLSRALGVSYSDFYPITGTLETLVSTGDIRLLGSEPIRNKAIQLASEYRGVMGALDRTEAAAWSTPFVEVLSRHQKRGASIDLAGFENDPQLRSVAEMSIGIALTRLNGLNNLYEDNNSLLELLRNRKN